jgi:alkylhydroperoxidase family enzyme
MSETSFLAEVKDPSPAARALFQEDLDDGGYVMNTSRLWAHHAEAEQALAAVARLATERASLSMRDKGILVTSAASTLGDSYCSLVWGGRLADAATPEISAAVLRGEDDGLDDRERTLAVWARQVAADPNAIRAQDVQALRDRGYDDGQIFGITCYIAVRVAMATVNDALGARPDIQLRETIPAPVLGAVQFGRPLADPTE